MDAIAEQLVSRLQSDPNDIEAYEALKAHYRETRDAPSLTNLIAGWAAYQRDRHKASRGFYEAAQVVTSVAPHHDRRLQLLRKAVERDIEFREAVVELAEVMAERGDDHGLAEFLDQHLRALEDHNTAHELRALLYARLGELWSTRFERQDIARQCYERALALDSRTPAIVLGARALAEASADATLLARALAAQAENEPDPERKCGLYRAQAEAHMREPADLNGAVQALRAAHQIAPDDVPTMAELADALARRAATQKSEAAARDRRRAAELHYLIAQLVSPSEAFASVRVALHLVPHHDGALHLLERHAEQLGQQELLPQYWLAYISHAAAGPEVDQRRVYLARAYERAGKLDDAIACLDDVQTPGIAANLLTELRVRRGPGSPSNRPKVSSAEPAPLDLEPSPLAKAHLRRTSSERGLEAEQRIRELRKALRNAIAAGDRAATVERASEIRAIDPDDPEAFLLLSTHYRRHGDYAQLRELLSSSRVASATPDEGKQRLREVAVISELHLNDLAAAIEAWRDVVALDPNDIEAAASLKRLLARAKDWNELVAVLEREAVSTADTDRQAALLRQIVAIHRDQRDDKHEACNGLRRLHTLQPTPATRDELCELLLAAEAYAEVVPLLWQRAHAAEGEREHLRMLRQLAEIFETAVHEGEAAFDVCTRILALRPTDTEALACMQRIDEKSGNAVRLLGTLERRAALLPRDQRASLLLEMAKIAERSLDDAESAGEYYRRALELDPARPGVLDALCDLFSSREQKAELVALLEKVAQAERNPARRVEIRLRQARLLSGPLLHPTEAAAKYRLVLEHEENTEALTYLLEQAREEQDAETTASLCARLAAATPDSANCRALLYERAQLLVTELGRPHDAIVTLRNLLAHVDPDYEPAIEWLAELAGNIGDTAGLASALARRLDKSTTQEARVGLAKRLADLQEFELNDREQASAALAAWAKADPNDPAPQRRLRPLLEESGRYADLVATCDALATLETDPVARDEAALAAASISFAQLRNLEAAWTRLLPLLHRGHPKALQLLLAIARQSNRCEELSALCVQAAQEATSVELQGQLWGHAARIFREDLGDPSKAFEAALRLLATDLKNRDALTRVEEAAAQAGLWSRLPPIFDRLLKEASSDGERIELLVRHADLLERGAGDASAALDRVLQASTLAPSDETLIARAETLAGQCGRGPELVQLCEEQAAIAAQPAAQVEWLLRAARFAVATNRDHTAAGGYVEAALAATRADLSLWEMCIGFAQQLDAQAENGEPNAVLRALIAAHKRVAENGPPAVGATLILRASRLLHDRLNDERAAFDLLRAGCALLPLDEQLYDHLFQRAESTGRLDALDAHLARCIEDALDARTTACLIARRARLLEGPLNRPDDAANAYMRLLQLRPDDAQTTTKLRESLRRARRFQDLLVVIHKQTQHAKEPEERLELLKERAHVWELDLKNRWEAVDAWRRVLEFAPQDSEAIRALTRLDRRSLPAQGPQNDPPARGRDVSRDASDAGGDTSATPAVPAEEAARTHAREAQEPSLEELPMVDLVQVEETAPERPKDSEAPRSVPPPPPSGVRRVSSRQRNNAKQPPSPASTLPKSVRSEPPASRPSSSVPPRKL